MEIEATETHFKGTLTSESRIRREIITFNTISYGKHLFKLKLPVKIEAEPSTEGWILYHDELSILAAAPTIKECIA